MAIDLEPDRAADVSGAWDSFLARSPCGHFQQSSAWAEFKRSQGWSVASLRIYDGERIVGGVQVLHRTKRGLRIGFVSKGPVVDPDDADQSELVLRALRALAVRAKIAAVVVQPPDQADTALTDGMRAQPFLPSAFFGVIDSTILMDLSAGADAVFGEFRKSTRRKFRRAGRYGLTVREGREEDVPTFFQLMDATCSRQQVAPNPPTGEAMLSLWRSLSATGNARLVIAEDRGEPLAAIFTICFGDRMTVFKTGWNGLCRDAHPNVLVVCEALRWACANGYQIADFAGLDRSIAETILAGSKISPEQNNSRDSFKLGFGGRPKLLPEVRLLVPNAALRSSVRLATAITLTGRRLKQTSNSSHG
ncbi:MAG: lipid II:glycine glycyltransferase FemX [Verrucomicrobiales bacterium]